MKRAIAGSLALSFVAGIVYAQAPAPATPSQGGSASVEFNSIDANRDGRLSTGEVQSHSDLKSSFATLDADRDNYLSQSEYAKWSKAGKMEPGKMSPSTSDTPVTEPAK